MRSGDRDRYGVARDAGGISRRGTGPSVGGSRRILLALTVATALQTAGSSGCGFIALSPPPIAESDRAVKPPHPTISVAEKPADAGLRAPAVPAAPHPEVRQPSASSLANDGPRVQHFLNRYRANPRSLRESLERAAPYLANISAVFTEEGLPPELAYLPIVESGFRTHAVSRAGAVGPWQFMRGTARRYGLRIDPRLDERRDPEAAARAAARYLRDLYDRFADWPLSLAAYNIGEGKVARARSRAGNADYWELCRRRYFPRETRDFVPRFLAVLQIAAEPQKFGLPATPQGTAPHRSVFVEGPLSLATVADLSGTGLREVETLNPALRRRSVPSSGYPIRLPRESAERFQLAWAQLEQVDSGIRHTVHRGETPGAIARRYRVDLGLLMRLNGIRNPRRLQIGTELRVPFPLGSARASGPTQAGNQLQALN